VQSSGNRGQTPWKKALEEASRRLPRSPAGALLFHEDRQDLTLVSDGRGPRPERSSTRTHGLAARGPFDQPVAWHQGAPVPDDALRLAEAVAAGERQVELRSEARTGAPPVLEDQLLTSRLGEDCLRAALGEALSLHPSAEVQARWIEFDQSVLVGSPGGEVQSDRRRGRRIRLEARIVVGQRAASAVAEAAGLDLDEAAVRRLARGLIERLNAQARAHPTTPGDYPVIFAPGVGGVLVHEIVGHALEGDVSLGRGSWLGRLAQGDVVASPSLSVIDDPRRGRGAWQVDDEGQAARPTALVRNGRLAGCLSDLRCAQLSGRPSSGHGRRSSYREPVLPRMGCTFVAAGRDRPEQLLEGVDDGIYVRRMEAAATDPWTGLAVFRVTDADRIHRGRLTFALMPHVLRVDGRRLLRGIERVASDLTFDSSVGSCVRNGQPLSISVGAPTIRTGLIRVLS
jgi:predicted Zn-dependent protease